jgi:transcription initiation factor TFIID subunit 7
MLLVEQRISGEEVVSNQKSFNIDDFIWPHGITPPPAPSYQKETIQERENKWTIKSVEQEVERLLEQDALAEGVKYGTSLRHQSLFLLFNYTL